MRVEATVPASRGEALVELAQQLGLTRSQIIDEAIALFLKAIAKVAELVESPPAATPALKRVLSRRKD